MSVSWIVGEALIDLIPNALGVREPKVGGGPANTAKAVARLGHKTFFIGGISQDEYGILIERELLESGVDISLVNRSQLPTALAIATINERGIAHFEFQLENTITFDFSQSWLPVGKPSVIHIGSVATLVEPGSSELRAWIHQQSVPVIFDPNVRPSIEPDKERYRAAVERWIEISSIVKLSQDDVLWLYGNESVVHTWLERGVSIVVLTRADKGITVFGADFSIEIPAVAVSVVDTVGAGDTIGAVVVEGVLIHGVNALRGEVLQGVLERAARAASITCSRAGANPPTRDELENS